MKEIFDKLDFIKIKKKKKTSAPWKTMSREWEDKPQTGRNYLQKASDKGPIQNVQKTLKLNNKKTNNSTKKWAKDFEQTPHQRR